MENTGSEDISKFAGNSNSSGDDSDTSKFVPSEEQPILVTNKAVIAIKNAIKEGGEDGDGLRVSVRGGGCSGYEYNLDFDKEERMGDTVLSFGDLNVYIDPVSKGYLFGTVVDYITGLNEQGFKFLNPNAKRTCGCGNSFS